MRKVVQWLFSNNGLTKLLELMKTRWNFFQGVKTMAHNEEEHLRLPYGASEDWLIAFVDVETTGLNPGYHEMVDAGIVTSTLDGEKRRQFHCRIMPDHPQRASREIQNINGFTEQRWSQFDALNKPEAVKQVQQFLIKDGDKNLLFCAHNESFDYPFLDHLFRSADEQVRELFDYTLDLPSIAWGRGYRQLHASKLVNILGVEEEPKGDDPETNPWEHTGLTGALKNLRIYRALMESDTY